ncbi:MAG: pyruvate kinase [Calditrichia bacterium]
MRKTKIVATLGPASSSPEMIRDLIKAGVNVFRLNFSHEDHAAHLERIRLIQSIREEMNIPVAILQDLTGQKIRLGEIAQPGLTLRANDTLILDATFSGVATGSKVSINYPHLVKDVFVGARLLLADGDLEVEVVEIQDPAIISRVITGGTLTSHKGINFPSGSFDLPAMTEKDKADLEFGLKSGVDLVALSFVKDASDLQMAREIFKKVGRAVPLIAKIEKHEAIENIEEIVAASDGIMIARGDLGVEIRLERVPVVQKKIMQVCNRMGRPVITATQMLRSMVDSPRPTRAEVTDVANAIFDGTDALMLSEETAVGKYPVRAVETMSNIALETEKLYQYGKRILTEENGKPDFAESVADSAVVLAKDLQAKFLVAVTRTGYTARQLSKFRPNGCILALTPDKDTFYNLAYVWGVKPYLYPLQSDFKDLLKDVRELLEKIAEIEKGDRYVVTAGFPLGEPGSTNLINAGQF